MKANILKRTVLENIPSGSGIEVIDGLIYIIGDDSPYLYCLDHNLKLLEKIELFTSHDFATGRIPKNLKPDLECMTIMQINNNKYILVAGSGSGEKRNTGFLVKLPTKYNKKHFVELISFHKLYDLLREYTEITGGELLNLEAAACSQEHFIFFNRGNKVGKNVILNFKLEEFIVYITENPDMVPFPTIYPMVLPSIKEVQAGFSGATVFDNKIFYTASVENTPNAIDDGEVYGSMVGIFNIESADYLRGANSDIIKNALGHAVIMQDEKVYLGKVESISVYEKDGESKYIALAITDDDKGGSELLMLEINL